MSTVEGSSSGQNVVPYDYGTEDKSSGSNKPPMFMETLRLSL
jgi:hypothetical protein